MAGLLNAEQAQPTDGLEDNAAPQKPQSQNAQDPVLQKIEKDIEAAVPKEMKTAYLRIIDSGMKVMFSQNTSQFMEQRLQQSGDIVEAVSRGIADLLLLIYNESKRTMSIPAAMLAAFSLMAQALDFAQKTGKAEISQELVEQCADATWQAVTAKFGFSKDQIDQAIAHGGGQSEQEWQEEQPPAQQGGLLQQQPMGA